MLMGEPFGGLIPGSRGAVLHALLRTDAAMTGRQIHGLLAERHSLWAVQAALKELAALGIVDTQTIGRAGVHTINEDHIAVAHLRALSNPFDALRTAVEESLGSGVESVIVFGSVARGEARASSDIDLAVIAAPGWTGHLHVEDAIRSRLGSPCDVLVFTKDEFCQLAAAGEPVVADILRDGLALIGTPPRVHPGAA